MSRVVPAILTEDPEALEKMIRLADEFTDFVQLDIMDGRFVPSRSIKAEDIAKLQTSLKWEAHLMVDNPQQYLKGFKQAGAKRVVFHYEATDEPLEVISKAREMELEVGLAINPETDITKVLPLTDKLNCLLFLSVNPGFYGSPFIPEVLEKIRQFRVLCPSVETGIDGGVKEGNIADIAATGVDYICIGSAIFLSRIPAESYRRLSALAKQT